MRFPLNGPGVEDNAGNDGATGTGAVLLPNRKELLIAIPLAGCDAVTVFAAPNENGNAPTVDPDEPDVEIPKLESLISIVEPGESGTAVIEAPAVEVLGTGDTELSRPNCKVAGGNAEDEFNPKTLLVEVVAPKAALVDAGAEALPNTNGAGIAAGVLTGITGADAG